MSADYLEVMGGGRGPDDSPARVVRCQVQPVRGALCSCLNWIPSSCAALFSAPSARNITAQLGQPLNHEQVSFLVELQMQPYCTDTATAAQTVYATYHALSHII